MFPPFVLSVSKDVHRTPRLGHALWPAQGERGNLFTMQTS
jgi:hypothetical protein